MHQELCFTAKATVFHLSPLLSVLQVNGSGSVFGAALEHLPLDELELGSLRGLLVSAVLDVDLTAAAGRLSASMASPRFSGLAGSSLTATARYRRPGAQALHWSCLDSQVLHLY